MDQLTLDKIKLAHPKVREELFVHYKEANNLLGEGVRLRFSYVFRTSKEQHELFLKRPKVTNADAWQSIHNYGLAFDIVLLYDNDKNGTFEEASWSLIKDGDNDKKADWMEVANYFKSKGWEWGGDWKKFVDAPHFQKDFGFHWSVLKQRIDKGITIVDSGITYPMI